MVESVDSEPLGHSLTGDPLQPGQSWRASWKSREPGVASRMVEKDAAAGREAGEEEQRMKRDGGWTRLGG